MNRFGLSEDEFDVTEPVKMGPDGLPLGPGDAAGEPAGPGNAQDAGINEALKESKDPAMNSQSYDATAKLRGGKTGSQYYGKKSKPEGEAK